MCGLLAPPNEIKRIANSRCAVQKLSNDPGQAAVQSELPYFGPIQEQVVDFNRAVKRRAGRFRRSQAGTNEFAVKDIYRSVAKGSRIRNTILHDGVDRFDFRGLEKPRKNQIALNLPKLFFLER